MDVIGIKLQLQIIIGTELSFLKIGHQIITCKNKLNNTCHN